MRRISVCVLLGCALLALVWACGGGRPVMVGNDPSVVSGRVLITPVGGATVRLVALSPAMERRDVLATTTTDSSGGFSFTVPAAQPSDVLLVASAGSYIEPSIGLGVQLGENELTFLLPDFK